MIPTNKMWLEYVFWIIKIKSRQCQSVVAPFTGYGSSLLVPHIVAFGFSFLLEQPCLAFVVML